MACKSRNNSRGNFSKFNPLKFVKNIHKKPECASLDSKTKERSHGPTTKSQSLIKFQISTSLGINSKELHPTTSNVKGKWRPNFLKYLRSPKVCPLPKRRNSGVVIPLESTSTIVASAGRDTNEMCVDFAAKDLHILTGSLGTDALVNDSNADDKRSCVSKGKLANSTNLAPVDETSAPGSLSSGGLCSVNDKFVSTTAHLLSLLDPEDLKKFHSRGIQPTWKPPTVISATKTNVASRPQPFTFQIIGHNGYKLLETIFIGKGWVHAPDAPSSDVKCIWMEHRTNFNVWNLREGHQMLNHIQNTHLLSNKLSLMRCLQEYNGLQRRGIGLKMTDFVPETYRLDLKRDRDLYFQQHKGKELWICKPAMLNQGKGIFLVDNVDDLRTQLREVETKELSKNPFSRPTNVRLIQRYISNPLLLDGRKADIRAYMLIACTRPFVVLFRDGYVRLSCSQYDSDSLDLLTHLTNQCMQRKDPQYETMKEETVWHMNRLYDYIVEKVLPGHPCELTWDHSTIRNQMCRIMLYCFHAVKGKLERRIGLYELLGFDFLVDYSFKVWLLEVNCNPSLQINCQVLKQIIPSVLNESLDISQECFEKSRQGLRILPLHSKKDFVLLYCEEMPYMRTIPKVLSPGRSRKRDSKGIIACQSKESSITIPVSSNLSKMHSLDARSFDG